MIIEFPEDACGDEIKAMIRELSDEDRGKIKERYKLLAKLSFDRIRSSGGLEKINGKLYKVEMRVKKVRLRFLGFRNPANLENFIPVMLFKKKTPTLKDSDIQKATERLKHHPT